MRKLEVINFSGMANCTASTYFSLESFLPISYKFVSGRIYGFASDYGCGSWGLATALTGRGQWEQQSRVYIDDVLCDKKTLETCSGNIFDPVWEKFGIENTNCTVRYCVEHALYLGQLKFSHGEIKDIFCLTDARYNRPITEVSGEIWNVSLALLFAMGKDIIAYPWLNAMNARKLVYLYKQGILDFLKGQNKIVFVPSSQKVILNKCCDNIIDFIITTNKAKIKYQ